MTHAVLADAVALYAAADENDIATTAESTQEAPETQVEEVAEEAAETEETPEE